MKEAFHYFLAADGVAMPPFKWGMTILFAFFFLFALHLSWKRGFRGIDIISLLLTLTILFRSTYPLFGIDGTQDLSLRLLSLFFPVAMSVLILFLFTTQNNLRKEQAIIGSLAILTILINISFGGALVVGSIHWWDHTYSLIMLNRVWLIGGIIFSIYILLKSNKGSKTYTKFIMLANLCLALYLIGYFLYSTDTYWPMYWVMRYFAFVSDIILIYAYSYLVWKFYKAYGRKPMGEGSAMPKINILKIMRDVPSDKLVIYWEVHHELLIPNNVKNLSPRQKLHAILMINKVSIKDSAEYTFITPEAVNVYRSRIRKKLS